MQLDSFHNNLVIMLFSLKKQINFLLIIIQKKSFLHINKILKKKILKKLIFKLMFKKMNFMIKRLKFVVLEFLKYLILKKLILNLIQKYMFLIKL